MRKQRRQLCQHAIMDLMSDHVPRTSEQIADLTGFSHGRIRSELSKNFNFAKEKRSVAGGGRVTFHKLRKHKHKPIKELRPG